MFLIYYNGESRKERERVDSLEHSLLVIDNTLALVKILPDVCKVVPGNSTIPLFPKRYTSYVIKVSICMYVFMIKMKEVKNNKCGHISAV